MGGGGVEKRWGEGEEFGAKGALQGGAEGEFVEEVGEGNAGGVEAGGGVVEEFSCDAEDLRVG